MLQISSISYQETYSLFTVTKAPRTDEEKLRAATKRDGREMESFRERETGVGGVNGLQ